MQYAWQVCLIAAVAVYKLALMSDTENVSICCQLMTQLKGLLGKILYAIFSATTELLYFCLYFYLYFFCDSTLEVNF